jgi:arylamine N-acetyltransferase
MTAAPRPQDPSPITRDPSWTDRYLALLGLKREPPSLDALTRLVKAHVLAVPFENVTALLRWRDNPSPPVPHPDPETLLTSWEQRRGGGVCFDIVTMVSTLLTELGYDADSILAHISGPFGHQAVVVRLDGRRYLVDLGNGAPLFAPIPLDGIHEVHRHGLGFRFRPAEDDPRVPGTEEWIRDRMSEDGWVQGCRYELQPGLHADRDVGYQHHLTAGTTWVLGSLTMNRSSTEAVYALKDDTLTRYTASVKEVTVLTTPAEYRHVAAEVFELPGLPIEEALAVRKVISGLAAGRAAGR